MKNNQESFPIQDIDVEHYAEVALKESEQRFRTIFDNATDGILLADLENKKFYTGNGMICQMLGYTLEEIKNLGVMEIHPEEDLSYVIEQFEKQSRGEITLAEDIPVKRKDGSVFYADVNSSLITLAGNTYLMGIFRDITKRKRTETALLVRQERLKAINEIAIEVAGMSDINKLLQTIIDQARELVEAEVGVIVLIDLDTGAIGDVFSSNYPMDKIPPGVEVQGQGVLGRIAAGEIIYTEDVTQESDYIGYPDWHPKIHACLGFPVQFAGKLQALLLLGHTDEQFTFSDDDRELVQTLVNLAAVTIHTARQFQDIRDARIAAEAANRAKSELLGGMIEQYAKEENWSLLPAFLEQLIQEYEKIEGDMDTAVDDTSTSVIDFEEALEQVDGDKDFLKELIELSLESYPEYINEIRKAIEQNEPRKLEAAAHTLKGASGSISANSIYQISSRLETMGKEGVFDGAKEALESLESEIERFNRYFSEHEL
ncbi:MAG: PAS domain S-box protein [Candidatus Poribacteria bacterium]